MSPLQSWAPELRNLAEQTQKDKCDFRTSGSDDKRIPTSHECEASIRHLPRAKEAVHYESVGA
mgnify:CR=1 FL=1